MNGRLAAVALAAIVTACGRAETPSGPEPVGNPGLVVTSVRWEPPQPLADAGERPFGRCSPFSNNLCRLFYEQTAPVVAASAGGAAVALWQQWEGDAFRLVAGRFSPGAGWSEAGRVTAESPVRAQRVVVDPRGNAVALWFGGAGGATSFGLASGGWAPPQQVEAADELVMGDDGAAHLLFRRWREGLFWSRLAPGSTWSAPVALQLQGPSSQPFISDPRLVVTRGGVAHAVWVRGLQSPARDEEWNEVWASRMRPGQSWSEPVTLARYPRAYTFTPALAATDAGVLASYVLVEGAIGPHNPRRLLEQHATGAAATPAFTAPDPVSEPLPPPPAVRNAALPVAASDGRGALTLAWTETTYAPSEPMRYEIRARRFSAATGTWEHAQLIASVRGFLYDRFGLHVAASAAGNAVVVWVEQDTFGAGLKLWASAFVPGAGWSAPETLRVGERFSAPSLAMDGSGNAFVLWSEPDGDRTRIWSARLAAVTVPAS